MEKISGSQTVDDALSTRGHGTEELSLESGHVGDEVYVGRVRKEVTTSEASCYWKKYCLW